MRKLLFVLLVLGLIAIIGLALFIPAYAERVYGPSNPLLDSFTRLKYASLMLWYNNQLTMPVDRAGVEQEFVINPGESAASVAENLEGAGLVRSAASFRDYLVYNGLDTTIQAGTFHLSPAMPTIVIAKELQDATPEQITFVILAGWRLEEIAASLPTSGLAITPDEFMAAARAPRSDLDFIPAGAGSEGFLLPAKYILPRNISANDLVTLIVRNFALYLGPDLRQAIERQGLTVYEAVTLASMVEREAIVEEEMPLIASVFHNRLTAGMKFDSDPTVQYAIGWNPDQKTWWTNPLSLEDLQINSSYNTYLNIGFPPGPISNPSLAAIQAVAYPAQTPYYYFRALCDGSGKHAFAESFDEHVNNACQ
jgi:UPF0755 protein